MNESTEPLSRFLGNAGAMMTLTYLGKEHPVAAASMRVHDRFEKQVVKLASAKIAAFKGVLPEEELGEMRARLQSQVMADEQKMLGELWREQFNADKGQRGIFIVLFCCLEEGRDAAKRPNELPPAIPFADMAKVFRDSPDAKEVLAVMVPDFFRVFVEESDISPEEKSRFAERINPLAEQIRAVLRSPAGS